MAYSNFLNNDFEMGFSDILDEAVIKHFLLFLYYKNIFNENNTELIITKSIFLSKLKELWKNKEKFNTDEKFVNILEECKLVLVNTIGEELFVIDKKVLFEYEDNFLNELDHNQISKTLIKHTAALKKDQMNSSFDSRKEYLEFKTCVLIKETCTSIFSGKICDICSLSFAYKESFEEHLEEHTSTSNFEWKEKNRGSPFARFQIFYQISEDSQFYKFNLSTQYSGIKIKSVVTVRSKDIPLLFNHTEREVEIDEGGCYEFLIDRHLFIKSIEQPIYIIFSMFVNEKQDQRERFVELHTILPNLSLPQKKLTGLTIQKSALKRKKGIICNHFPRDSLKELYSRESFNENDIFDINDNFRKFCLENEKNLTVSSYSEILTLLLEMEDIETEIFYRNFFQVQTQINCLKKSKHDLEYFVKLKNLPDGEIFQSTINCGDEIILFCNENSNDVDKALKTSREKSKTVKKFKNKFFGTITNIYGTTVYFESQKDKIDITKTFDIQFRPNRRNLVYQYSAIKAVDEYSLISLYLFPEKKQFKPLASLDLDIFNENVKNNPEQKEAVVNIVEGIKDFLPYIIVGPPGTGKTTTIVESIIQLQIQKPQERILVTAGSNAACNEIAKRLVKIINQSFQNIKMLRLFSKSVERSYEHIDNTLLNVSNLLHGHHFYPSLETINEYNIVICTTSLVGRLKSAGLQPTNISHCFIDEGAALTEPEILVAIEAVFHSNVNIIIAGDTKQLGPILQSNRAAEYGLKRSLLDRLLDREPYRINCDKTYNNRIQTRLVRNFRTHPDILSISNKIFYSNDLLTCAKMDLTHWATGWCKLLEKKLPLIFHHVSGYTKKDKYSTSLFNPREVDVVLDYVKRLMYFQINDKKIKEEDIGIISPYKKQNALIREELDKRNWYKIGTGSVETFQGQEKPIIIISTVRSVLSDRTGVGFLVNEKRLNVMLTRAEALLIIIGNAECLSSVPNWKETIHYCKEKNVFLETKDSLNETSNTTALTDSIKNIFINL